MNDGIRLKSSCIPPIRTVPSGGQLERFRGKRQGSELSTEISIHAELRTKRLTCVQTTNLLSSQTGSNKTFYKPYIREEEETEKECRQTDTFLSYLHFLPFIHKPITSLPFSSQDSSQVCVRNTPNKYSIPSIPDLGTEPAKTNNLDPCPNEVRPLIGCPRRTLPASSRQRQQED